MEFNGSASTDILRKIGNLLSRGDRRPQLQKDIELLSHSALFDADWYLTKNPDVAQSGADPISHFLLHGAKEGRDPGEQFSTLRYLEDNPDVRRAGMNPLVHYLRHGAAEGRRLPPVTLPTESVPEEAASHDVFGYMETPANPSTLPARVAIGISSLGNFFMAEIAYMLQDAFQKLGVAVRIFAENQASAVLDYEAIVIVAPHEFFLLGEGPRAFKILRGSTSLIMFNVEQPQTQWFRVGAQYMPHATAILDIHYHTACQLTRSGHRSFFFPLGYSEYMQRTFNGRALPDHEVLRHLAPAVRNSEPATYAERPIDILFIGASSPRREKFFSTYASYFATKDTVIYLPRTARPFLSSEARSIGFATYAALVRRSKVLLNVHQDDVPFLEWQRIVNLGIMQRTMVVTDHCAPVPCIEPNLDYLDGSLSSLPGLCEFALHNLHEVERMADRAHAKLKMRYPIEEILARCWTALSVAGQRDACRTENV